MATPVAGAQAGIAELARASDELEQIEIQLLLEGIYRHYGFDFRGYAPSSLKRRLWRRAYAEKVESISRTRRSVAPAPPATSA